MSLLALSLRMSAAKRITFNESENLVISPSVEPWETFPLELVSCSMDVHFTEAPQEVKRSFFSSDGDSDYKVSFNDAYHQPMRQQSLAVLHSVVYQNAEAQGVGACGADGGGRVGCG